MKLHDELEYDDLNGLSKIVITKDMVNPIVQTFLLYEPNFIFKHEFKTLNIELLLLNKINIFIEKEDETYAMATFFLNEKKLFSFEIEYSITDRRYSIFYIFEYNEINMYNLNVEKAILWSLNWYTKILFYKQWNKTIDIPDNNNGITFFINTKNSKLNDKKKSR